MTNAMMTIQGTRTNATTPPATTGQNPGATSKQDLQQAAQQLREAFQNDVNREMLRANAKAAAQAAAGQAAMAQDVGPVQPTPPPARQITIRGPDGQSTIISVPPRGFDNVIPPQARDISIAFFVMIAAIIIGLPIARAFARAMDRRGGSAQIPTEISSQLAHLNQAVDAIALEVERISEGQRFTARLLSEQRDSASQTLPSGASR